MKVNRWAAAGLIAILLLAAAAYFSGILSEPAKAYTLRASLNNDCTGTPWFVGEQEGFFKKNGMEFVDVGQTAATQRSYALAMGQIDVLDADPLTLVNLLKSGVNVKAIAQSGSSSTDGDLMKEYMHWDVLPSSELATFASINNSSRPVRIGVSSLGCSADLQTNALMRKYGIPADKVEYVVIPDANQQQALREKIIDIAVLPAAYYACTEKRLGTRVLATSTEALGPAGGTTLLICRQDFIDAHPDTLARFIKGYKEAERWCNENRKESGAITADRLGLCTGVSHYYSENGTVDESQLQVWLDEMAAQGLIAPGEYRPSDLYTGRFRDSW